MSYTKYLNPQPLLHIPSSGTVLGLGFFEPATATQLNGVKIYLASFGTAGGSETLTAKIYGNDDLTGVVASSTAVTRASLENIGAQWLGWALFLFSTPVPLAASKRYYLGLTTANYTKNGTTFFMAVQLDKHAPFYQPAWGRADQIAKFRLEGKRQWPE